MLLNTTKGNKYIQFIVDIAAISLSFIISLTMRYYVFDMHFVQHSYEGNFYVLIFVFLILIYIPIFMVFYARDPLLIKQDPIEKLRKVVRNQFLQFAGLMFLLFLIQSTLTLSRSVVMIYVFLSILLDFIFRIILGRITVTKMDILIKKVRCILVSDADNVVNTAHWLKMNNSLSDGRVFNLEAVAIYGGGRRIEGIKTLNLENLISECARLKTCDYDLCCIALPNASEKEIERIMMGLSLETKVLIPCEEGFAAEKLTGGIGDLAAVNRSCQNVVCPVLGIGYRVTNIAESAAYVRRNSDELRGRYICFSNVHTTMMADKDESYRELLNRSVMVYPDGNPIARVQRQKGFLQAQRVAGPDFMSELFRLTMDGRRSHYFYGSTEETIIRLLPRLRRKFPGIRIAGAYSPPFRPLTEEEDREVVSMINGSGADFVWIGLGAPKQERWMSEHENVINAVMLGVGAGFDFHAGTIKRAPLWVQRIGMEWVYRLFQDPKRLIGRYVATNFRFILRAIQRKV